MLPKVELILKASQPAGGCGCCSMLAAALATSSCVIIKGVLQCSGYLSGSCFLIQELQPILSHFDQTLCCVFPEASVWVLKCCSSCSLLPMEM